MPTFKDNTERLKNCLWPLIPKVQRNYIFWHYCYFITTCLFSSVLFYLSSKPFGSVAYVDCLFLCVSAMTEAGLNTVNLSEINTAQQVILWFLIIIGSSIFVSIFTVWTRRWYFEQYLKGIIRMQREARSRPRPHRRSSSNSGLELPVIESIQPTPRQFVDKHQFESRHSGARDPTTDGSVDEVPSDKHVAFEDSARDQDRISPLVRHRNVLTFVDVDAHSNSTSQSLPRLTTTTRAGKLEGTEAEREALRRESYPNYLNHATIGRNGQFYGLTQVEREHLGGVEYRAVCLMSWVVPFYFVLFQLFGCIGVAAYTTYNKSSVSRENGIDPAWLGSFNVISAFNNSGMSLLDLNMIPFRTSPYILVTLGLEILAGNTAYPLFLRLILWCLLKFLEIFFPIIFTELKGTLRFILKYPRRVYTHLFPTTSSWWLLLTVLFLNSIDWAAFELLNLHNPATGEIPSQYRVLDGLFQAVAVRHAGFAIVSISQLAISLQFLYMIMMYINIYPIAITMRHSNVYEERSLGLYGEEEGAPGHQEEGQSFWSRAGTRFIGQQITGQLFHDLWMLGAAIFVISIAETGSFNSDPITYSIFNIAFEVVSGYGCVGLSTGLPDQNYSFSGGWHVLSKVILCFVMLRGRHRGLSTALDKAVELPRAEDALGAGEEQDHRIRASLSGLQLDNLSD